MKMVLERYHGLGNDYLVFDPNKNELELNPKNVSMLCNRNMGLGIGRYSGGTILGEKHMAVRIWNPGRKHCTKEWKRRPHFCEIFERCGICTKEKIRAFDGRRGSGDHLSQ